MEASGRKGVIVLSVSKKLVIGLVFIMLFTSMFNLGLVNDQVLAGTFTSAYEILKNDPDNQVFLQRIFDAGATESELENFLNDLETQVELHGPLTTENFDRLMYDAVTDVLSWRTHRNVFRAISNAYGDEIDYTLENDELHPTLLPLRNAVFHSLLGDEDTDEDDEDEGAPYQDVIDSINDQLLQGSKIILLTAEDDFGDIGIPASAVQLANQKEVPIRLIFGDVIIDLPVDSILLADGTTLLLGCRQLSDKDADKETKYMDVDHQLIGSVYNLTAVVKEWGTNFRFKEDIKVSLPYEEEDLASKVDSLNIYRYDGDEHDWQLTECTVDERDNKVTFTVGHFSHYAVFEKISDIENQPVKNEPIPVTFADISGHWAEADIRTMVQLGFVSGMSAAEFAPDRKITRAEFAALLVRVLGVSYTPQLRSRFVDVPVAQWYYEPVNAASQAGLVSGVDAQHFAPQQEITREQMAVMISRALGYRNKGVEISPESAVQIISVFADHRQIGSWAQNGVAATYQKNIVKGKDGGLFDPAANATRAEATAMLYRMYQQL